MNWKLSSRKKSQGGYDQLEEVRAVPAAIACHVERILRLRGSSKQHFRFRWPALAGCLELLLHFHGKVKWSRAVVQTKICFFHFPSAFHELYGQQR